MKSVSSVSWMEEKKSGKKWPWICDFCDESTVVVALCVSDIVWLMEPGLFFDDESFFYMDEIKHTKWNANWSGERGYMESIREWWMDEVALQQQHRHPHTLSNTFVLCSYFTKPYYVEIMCIVALIRIFWKQVKRVLPSFLHGFSLHDDIPPKPNDPTAPVLN